MLDMPDAPIEADSQRSYPHDMEARLRVLDEIAAGTKAILTEIRADQRAMRSGIIAMDQRRERDFRLAFGAIITTSLGLAYLIAHTAHWL
jgi:hypothetical protein